MDMKKRRDMQLAYIADKAAMEEMVICRQILQKLNFADRSDFDGVTSIVKELLGKSEGACINPPYIVKSFFLENQGFFSVSSINISEEGAIGMDISLYLVRK